MKRMIKASDLGRYVGGRLMTQWTASLLVYGAESSPDFDFEESFTGGLNECLTKLKEYERTIRKNHIDGYLTLESDNSDFYEGDYDSIYYSLEEDGYV